MTKYNVRGGVTLSPREKEVLVLSSNGLCNKEIAKELGISYGTVRNHIDKAVLRLHACGITHAVSIAIRNNLI